VIIRLNYQNVDQNTYFVFPESTKVYPCYVSKCNNSGLKESFKYASPISDYILKLKGGDLPEISDKEMEKLIKSIEAKTSKSFFKRRSLNKILKIIYKRIEPVITDQRFLKLVHESQKPIKSELSLASEVRSTDILGSAQKLPENRAKNRSKGSSSIFAEVFSNPRKLSPMQKSVQLKMAKKKNNFSNLNSLGRSECLSPTLTPTMLEASQVPTAEMFRADARTGVIQDINIAFEQFQKQMTEIGNQ